MVNLKQIVFITATVLINNMVVNAGVVSAPPPYRDLQL